MNHYIGIDIAKASLQIFIPKGDMELEVENSVKGLKSLFSKLKKNYRKSAQDLIWIYEPTGAYWSTIKSFCHEKNIACFIVKPSQSSAFAKSVKNRNKTDIVDARMLYRMHTIARTQDIKVPEFDKEQERLKNYIRYYKALVRDRMVKVNQLEACVAREDETSIIHKLRLKIKALQKEEKEIVQTMLEFISLHPNYQKQLDCITSFKGVGNLS